MKINRRLKTKTKQKQMKLKNEACGTHIFYLPVCLSVRLSCCPAAFGLVSKNRKQKQKQKVQKKQRLSFFSRLAKRKINNNNEQRISRVFSEGHTSKGSTAVCVCVCVTVVLIHRHTGKEVPNGKTGQHWPSERGK